MNRNIAIFLEFGVFCGVSVFSFFLLSGEMCETYIIIVFRAQKIIKGKGYHSKLQDEF